MLMGWRNICLKLLDININAPTLMEVMVPLLLYADDLILMSLSTSGLQKQLDA